MPGQIWATQTIHISVRCHPDAGWALPGVRPIWRCPAVKSARHHWPLDRHTTDSHLAAVWHVRISWHRSDTKYQIKVQSTFKCDCDSPIARFFHRALFTDTSLLLKNSLRLEVVSEFIVQPFKNCVLIIICKALNFYFVDQLSNEFQN